MKTTNRALAPAKSASDVVRPSTPNSENSGALVPNGNIVLGVKTMSKLLGGESCKDSFAHCTGCSLFGASGDPGNYKRGGGGPKGAGRQGCQRAFCKGKMDTIDAPRRGRQA